MFRIMVVFVLYKTFFVNFMLARPLYHDTKRWYKTKTCSVHVNSSLLFFFFTEGTKELFCMKKKEKKEKGKFNYFGESCSWLVSWQIMLETCKTCIKQIKSFEKQKYDVKGMGWVSLISAKQNKSKHGWFFAFFNSFT